MASQSSDLDRPHDLSYLVAFAIRNCNCIMRYHVGTALLGVLELFAATEARSIPPPTGKYAVGVRKEVIEYYNDHDPLAPNNISTSFLATIFYPTSKRHATHNEQPYLDPRTAAGWERVWGVPAGTITSLTSNLVPNAPFLKPKKCHPLHPTILFGPGAGGPATSANAVLLSDLASHGYTVIGLDHPYEHEWLLYPNGSYIPGLPMDYSWGLPDTLDELLALYALRLEDAEVFLEYLPDLKKKLDAPINTTHVGTLGHSIGGAAAIGQLYVNDIVKSGINMDGSMYDRPVTDTPEANTHKPSMVLVSEPNWLDEFMAYAHWQTEYFRGVRIKGSNHGHFTDGAFWWAVEGNLEQSWIDGERMVSLLRRTVREFFDYTLLGGEPPTFLESPNEEYPEMEFFDEDGVTEE